MVDEVFYEDDESIEKIQRIRRRSPDFFTSPHNRCEATVFLAPLPSGEWVEHPEPATWLRRLCTTDQPIDQLKDYFSGRQPDRP
ncbi:MAG: hypothetical protein ABIZ05_07860 [Pseudonocardiaceae bacterium]